MLTIALPKGRLQTHALERFVSAGIVPEEEPGASRKLIIVRHNLDTLDRQVPPWLETAAEGFEVTVRDLPIREQIDVPVREQLIIELYSK